MVVSWNLRSGHYDDFFARGEDAMVLNLLKIFTMARRFGPGWRCWPFVTNGIS